MELFEQIRREYEFGVGTIAGVSRKLGVHRWMMREKALRSAEPAATKPQQRRRRKLDSASDFIDRILRRRWRPSATDQHLPGAGSSRRGLASSQTVSTGGKAPSFCESANAVISISGDCSSTDLDLYRPMSDEKPTPLGPWMNNCETRMHRNVATVAVANGLARIAWAVLSSESL